MLPLYKQGKFTASRPANAVAAVAGGDGEADVPTDGASPRLLVSKLREGNPHVRANNRVVDQLEQIGEPAVAALMAAIEDRAFPRRGYAAWALTQVLKVNALAHEQAMKVLEKARRDSDGYVATLTRSGLSTPCEQVRGMQPLDSAFPVLGAKPWGIFMRYMIRGDRFGVCLVGGVSGGMSSGLENFGDLG